MLLGAALGAAGPIALFSRDFMRKLSWSLSGHTGRGAEWGEPLFLALLFGAALSFAGAVLGYVIASVRRPQDPARDRWLAWTCALFWGAMGAFGAFYVPRLRPIYDTFGGDLPIPTRLLLGGRPVFFMIFVAALAGAVFLKMRPAEPTRRKIVWACAGAALIAAYFTIMAVFAPMFMGTLAGPD